MAKKKYNIYSISSISNISSIFTLSNIILIVGAVLLIALAILLIVLFSTSSSDSKIHQKPYFIQHQGKKNLYTFDLKPITADNVANKDFSSPTSMTVHGMWAYVTTKNGTLYQLDITNGVLKIICDISKHKNFNDKGENGLLNITFDPTDNNTFYLVYTEENKDEKQAEYTTDMVVSRFKLGSSLDQELCEKGTEIFRESFRGNIHHAGTLQFAPDSDGKYIYLSTGDGGPQKDPHNEAQNMRNHRGKILKIDTYTKHVDIIALGLRNPWKFSIAKVDGKDSMFIGDVGMNQVESIYFIDNINPKTPYNFGWNYYEGSSHPVNPRGKHPNDFTKPIYEIPYGDEARAIMGGYYIEDLDIYVFGDYTGVIRALKENGNMWEEIGKKKLKNEGILSFGYDNKNQTLYLLGRKTVYLVEVKPT
jgi:glucose/arabinose dehydrogenase